MLDYKKAYDIQHHHKEIHHEKEIYYDRVWKGETGNRC